MPLDVVTRPNMVILAGLCLLICAVDIHFLYRRKQPADLALTLQHVLLGLLNLSCSLVCALGTLLSGWKDSQNHWPSVLVGFLWVMVFVLRLCYLAVPANRCFHFVHANILGLVLFLTTTLPEQVYPWIWLQTQHYDSLSVRSTVQLAAAFASAIALPLLTPGHTDPSEDECHPGKSCSPIQRWWLYTWVSPVVNRGYNSHGFMSPDDLLPNRKGCSGEAWLQDYSDQSRTLSFRATLWRSFRCRLAVTAFWGALCGSFELIGTIGLYQLLLFLQGSPDAQFHPWFSVILFGSCPILRGLCMQTFEYYATHAIGDAKSCITTAVYRKLMMLQADAAVDVGQLQSNISADIDRLGTLRYTMLTAFMAPVEIILSSIILYKIVGWYYIPSLVFLLVTRYPLNKFIISAQTKAQSGILEATDERITKTTESIRAMTAIKILGHVQPFIQRILGARNRELDAIWRKMQVIVASESVSSALTFLALLLCLLMYTVLGKMPSEPGVVFTVVVVFNIVNSMFSLSVLGAGQYAQTSVSLDRLSKFLDQPEAAHPRDETTYTGETASQDISITIQSGLCKAPIQADLELVAPGFNVVTGDVGSGKSLLLQSLLFNRQKLQKTQFEPIAYAPQNPWLFRGTIRDNILFGAPFDQERYKNVIKCCALEPDLATFKESDMKDVGEGGRRLSGGQRQRVTLARAVYSNADIVLLDDVLSGLDPKTFHWIVDMCILGPQLKNRTLILVSNNKKLLERADVILYMKDGIFFRTVRPSKSENTVVENGSTIDSSSVSVIDVGPEESDSPGENGDLSEDKNEKSNDLDNLRGRIGLKYVSKYIRPFGCWTFIATMAVFTISAQAMDVALPAWLSVWSQAYTEGHKDLRLGFFIGIFTGLGVARVLLLAISLMLLYSGAWRASRDKHLEMLVVVFGATYAWIWRTPAGQAINRFSSDMASLDDTLFKTLRPVLETYLSIAFRIFTVSSLIPLFLLPSIALTGLALYIGYRYRFASTAVKHMYAGSLTPLHHSISETASGLMTVHAFRAERILQERFNTAVDHHVRAWNGVSDLQRWLAVRMDLCVGCISFSVAVLAVTQQNASASTVGLSLTLTTGLCTSLLYLVYLSSLLEVEMTSYYRIESYIKDLPQEPGPCGGPNGVEAEDWPTQGVVHIRNLTAGYSWDENEVLKDISFSAQAGERVAIVGRTGSGKSSLALSLLRLATKFRGSITIDGVEVESLDVEKLRQRISLIPQDPTLFDGTIRFNLDPSGRVPDEHLQTILDDVAGASNKWHLDDLVEGNGKKFSHGERQLIVLARAIVSQNRILILDEGTAGLDKDSEARIHTVLRKRFKDCTVIAITHQLHNIIDFDRVLVLDRGRVAEQGNPRELLAAAGRGWFQSLYMQQHGPPYADGLKS